MTRTLPLLSSESDEENRELVTALGKALPSERVCLLDDLSDAQCARVDVAIAANPNSELLNRLPNLVWLQSLWAGVEQLIAPARERKLHVVRLVDPELTSAMSEAALAWTFYIHRLIPKYAQQQRDKHWQALPFRRADNTRVTVLGLGVLGGACATRLAQNNFKVSGWSTSPRELPGVACYSGNTGLSEVLSVTDILLVLLPLTEQTRYLLNAKTLGWLPKGAALINFARGAIVNTRDLLQTLDKQHLSHAVLDVFENEPLAAEDQLWTHPAVTILPHIAAPTDLVSAIAIVAEHIRAYRATGTIPKGVNLTRGF